MRVLTTRFKDQLLASEMENIKVFSRNWTLEEAAHHLMFDTTFTSTASGVATLARGQRLFFQRKQP